MFMMETGFELEKRRMDNILSNDPAVPAQGV
jgi:hypothetical protein